VLGVPLSKQVLPWGRREGARLLIGPIGALGWEDDEANRALRRVQKPPLALHAGDTGNRTCLQKDEQ